MKMKIAAVAALAFAAAATSANAQAARSATASANVVGTVIRPITLTNSASMLFGKMVAPAATTTFTIHPASAFEGWDDPSGIGVGAQVGSAKFSVGGEPGTGFVISFPSSSVELTSGANKMTLNAFKVAQTSMALSNQGIASFSVGATLTVSANQAVGTYTGTFPVMVTYQ